MPVVLLWSTNAFCPQVIAAAKSGIYAVGYELNPWLVLYSRMLAVVNRVSHCTEFHVKDLFKVCVCVCMCVCVCVCVCVGGGGGGGVGVGVLCVLYVCYYV